MHKIKPPKLSCTYSSREYRVIALREIPTPDHLSILDTPERAAEYFRLADSHGKTCAECRLCAGTSKRARSIAIDAHGSGKIYLNKNN